MSHHKAPSPFQPEPRVQHLDAFGDRLDVVGDVHGCVDEVTALLGKVGHQASFPDDPNLPATFVPAPGRALVFLGDLTDRGPRSRDSLRLLEGAILSGAGFSVMGNHDAKLLRALAGHRVAIAHGLQMTLDELADVTLHTRERWRGMLHALPHQISAPARDAWGGRITFVHGAAPAHHQDQENRNALARALYGYPNDAVDAEGRPVRDDWARTYAGERVVVHGHTPLLQPRVLHRVVCLDTGAVFGGHLTLWQADTGALHQIASPQRGYTRMGFVDRDRSERDGVWRTGRLDPLQDGWVQTLVGAQGLATPPGPRPLLDGQNVPVSAAATPTSTNPAKAPSHATRAQGNAR